MIELVGTRVKSDLLHTTWRSALVRNAAWNLFGLGAPILVSVVTIPVLVEKMGTDRFAMLTLAWMVIGYFNLFDFGLGRSLTKAVAERQWRGREHEVPGLFWTAFGLMLLLGLAGMLSLLAISPWLVHDVLKVPTSLQGEAMRSFQLMAVAVPVSITTTAFRGILEARQQFNLISIVQALMGFYTYAAPLLALMFSRSLVPVVAVLLAGRLAAWGAYLALCARAIPALLGQVAMKYALVGPLLVTGGWMTISNIISPLMVILDRFLIGHLTALAAVAYYSIPFDAVIRMLIIPAALSTVVFPTIASVYAVDWNRAGYLFDRAVKMALLALTPLTLVVIFLAREGLQIWLGPQFAAQSTRVLQCLVIGVLANGLAQMPFALLQGAGRADLTAKFHLLEFPIYLASVWWLVRLLGIEGAAIAWTLRAILDMGLLFATSKRLLPTRVQSTTIRWAFCTFLFVMITASFSVLKLDLVVKLATLATILVSYVVAMWFIALTWEQRSIIRGRPRPTQREETNGR